MSPRAVSLCILGRVVDFQFVHLFPCGEGGRDRCKLFACQSKSQNLRIEVRFVCAAFFYVCLNCPAVELLPAVPFHCIFFSLIFYLRSFSTFYFI